VGSSSRKTHNRPVAGSSPAAPTIPNRRLDFRANNVEDDLKVDVWGSGLVGRISDALFLRTGDCESSIKRTSLFSTCYLVPTFSIGAFQEGGVQLRASQPNWGQSHRALTPSEVSNHAAN
jgi:hypothetical protein